MFSALLAAVLAASRAFPFGTWAHGNVAQLGLEVPARATELAWIAAMASPAGIVAVWLGARGLGMKWWWALIVMIPAVVWLWFGETATVRFAMAR
jgi:hypothetical protein